MGGVGFMGSHVPSNASTLNLDHAEPSRTVSVWL